MSLKIIITDCNHGNFTWEKEESVACGVSLEVKHCTQKTLVEECQDADIIIVQRLQIDGKIIRQLPKCKVVTRYGVGIDNLNTKELASLGVSIVHFPDYCTMEVANHALASILFLYRRLDRINDRKKDLSKFWGNPSFIGGIRASASTKIGIVGVGRIGTQVAERLIACGFQVCGFDPYLSSSCWDRLSKIGVESKRSLKELCKESKFLSLHVPLTDETRKMMNLETISFMPPNSFLVNTSRGEVVNTPDLLTSLQNHLAAAFVDVIDPEPPPTTLLNVPNLWVSPHCAFYSQESLTRLKRGVITKSVEKYNEVYGD